MRLIDRSIDRSIDVLILVGDVAATSRRRRRRRARKERARTIDRVALDGDARDGVVARVPVVAERRGRARGRRDARAGWGRETLEGEVDADARRTRTRDDDDDDDDDARDVRGI